MPRSTKRVGLNETERETERERHTEREKKREMKNVKTSLEFIAGSLSHCNFSSKLHFWEEI